VLACVAGLPTTALVDRDDAEVTWVNELEVVKAGTLVVCAVSGAVAGVWAEGVHTCEGDAVEEGLRVDDLLLAVAYLWRRRDVREELPVRLAVTTVTLSTADLARAPKGVWVRDPTTCVVVPCRGAIVAAHAGLNWRCLADRVTPTLCWILLAGALHVTVHLFARRWCTTTVLVITVCVAIAVVIFTILTLYLRTGLVRPTGEAELAIALCTDGGDHRVDPLWRAEVNR
jgi:hypothetical protein